MKRPAISLLVCFALCGWAATSHAKRGGGKAAAAPAPAASSDTGSGDSAKGGDPAAGDQAGGARRTPSRTPRRRAAPAGATESLDTDESQPGKVEEDVVGPQGQQDDLDRKLEGHRRHPPQGLPEGRPTRAAAVRRHHDQRQPDPALVFGADINYFLTDVFWVGLRGSVLHSSAHERRAAPGERVQPRPHAERVQVRRRAELRLRPRVRQVRPFNRSIISWEIRLRPVSARR